MPSSTSQTSMTYDEPNFLDSELLPKMLIDYRTCEFHVYRQTIFFAQVDIYAKSGANLFSYFK